MADIDCPNCHTDEHYVVQRLSGTQRKLTCSVCGYERYRGQPEQPKAPHPMGQGVGRRFPLASDVEPSRLALVERRKVEFLGEHPEPEDIDAYWAKYQHIFSAEGLPDADPQDLKAFANSSVGARIGNMSVFNNEWNRLGQERAAEQMRKVIDYLLRGERPAAREDRLTELLSGRPVEMKGLKEAILTKVLCVVYPEDYMRYLVYTGEYGKREVTHDVWGLVLPDPKATSLSIGCLVQRSNDLLVELVGDGFKNLQHASDFIWWWVQHPARRPADHEASKSS